MPHRLRARGGSPDGYLVEKRPREVSPSPDIRLGPKSSLAAVLEKVLT
jgi:hypothetical protein